MEFLEKGIEHISGNKFLLVFDEDDDVRPLFEIMFQKIRRNSNPPNHEEPQIEPPTDLVGTANGACSLSVRCTKRHNSTESCSSNTRSITDDQETPRFSALFDTVKGKLRIRLLVHLSHSFRKEFTSLKINALREGTQEKALEFVTQFINNNKEEFRKFIPKEQVDIFVGNVIKAFEEKISANWETIRRM